MIDVPWLKLRERLAVLRRTIREVPALRSQIETLRQKEETLTQRGEALERQIAEMTEAFDSLQTTMRNRSEFEALKQQGETLTRQSAQITAEFGFIKEQLRVSDDRARSLDQRLAEFGRSIDRHPLFREAVALMQLYSQHHSMPRRPIIVAAHVKCGNTLVRFLYHHLIAATNSNATETLTYSRLNKVNPNHSFPDRFIVDGFLEPADFDHSGFPMMLHSHHAWGAYWDTIGDVLFIERHPIDALISRWYTQIHFPKQPHEVIGIDDFVLSNLPALLDFFKHNGAHAKARIRYEDMIADPFTAFGAALNQLGIAFDAAHLHQACELSRFEAVRSMEDARGEHHGHLADPVFRTIFNLETWKDDPDVRFTRSGETRQWHKELQPATIAAARATLLQHNFSEYADALG